MKFWTSGRLDEKIRFEFFQPVMLGVEQQINTIIGDRNYGDEIDSYDVVINIFKEGGEERFKYSPKKKETDIDVNIDHDEFLNADQDHRRRLYLDAVLRSIQGIRTNKNLKKFDFDGFSRDVSSLLDNYKSSNS